MEIAERDLQLVVQAPPTKGIHFDNAPAPTNRAEAQVFIDTYMELPRDQQAAKVVLKEMAEPFEISFFHAFLAKLEADNEEFPVFKAHSRVVKRFGKRARNTRLVTPPPEDTPPTEEYTAIPLAAVSPMLSSPKTARQPARDLRDQLSLTRLPTKPKQETTRRPRPSSTSSSPPRRNIRGRLGTGATTPPPASLRLPTPFEIARNERGRLNQLMADRWIQFGDSRQKLSENQHLRDSRDLSDFLRHQAAIRKPPSDIYYLATWPMET